MTRGLILFILFSLLFILLLTFLFITVFYIIWPVKGSKIDICDAKDKSEDEENTMNNVSNIQGIFEVDKFIPSMSLSSLSETIYLPDEEDILRITRERVDKFKKETIYLPDEDDILRITRENLKSPVIERKPLRERVDKFKKETYEGLILFDIDGTLTVDDQDNYGIVQAFLDNGFAVGVCTAGRKYNMENLPFFSWMPTNLYSFMYVNRTTFNNVADDVLMGMKIPGIYSDLRIQEPGYLKGYSLTETGRAMGIEEDYKLVLIDDQFDYINYAYEYNPDLTLVKVGGDQGKMTVSKVERFIKNLKTFGSRVKEAYRRKSRL